MRTISEWLKLRDNYDRGGRDYSPSKRADVSDAIVDELLEIFGGDRLEKICDAEREGRLVVLPCKVGDTVYTIEEKYYPCSECDLDESKRDMCYRKKTGYPVETIHECPEVIYIKEHVARGFDIDGTLETGAILSLPGKWGYEGLEHFCGRDGKCYYTREEAEAALKEESK